MANWLSKYEQGGMVLKQKTKDNYGKQGNYNDAKVSTPPGYVGLGYDTKGRNYSPAWGGQFAMGGSMPGAVGFTYARVAGSAPANGKYTKKTKASAQNGMEMKFYQEGLDFKPKTISKNGSKVIKDNRGQWAHPGEITEIDSNDITMQGVNYPVLGVSDTGDTKMMYPDQDYKFNGEKVTEFPMAQDGGWLDKYPEPMRQDATRNVVPRKMTDKERLEAVATSDQAQKRALNSVKEVITERKKNKATKGDLNTPGSWHTEDKARLFPSSVGGVGEMVDEYINPATYVGVLADALGESVAARDPKGIATSLALSAGAGALGFDPLTSVSKAPRKLLNAADRNFSSVGQDLAYIEKQGLKKGWDPQRIKERQMQVVGITPNQREAYVPGVSDFLSKYVTPFGYTGSGESKLMQTLNNIKAGEMNLPGSDDIIKSRKDSWNLYLGKPQKNNTFRVANTSPINHPAYSPEQLSKLDIYSINEGAYSNIKPRELNLIEDPISYYAEHLSLPTESSMSTFANPMKDNINLLENNIFYDKHMPVMGGYNKRLSKTGVDYNDIWDLEPTVTNPITKKPMKVKIDNFIGKPFMSHGVFPEVTSESISKNLNEVINKELEMATNRQKYSPLKITKGKQQIFNTPFVDDEVYIAADNFVRTNKDIKNLTKLKDRLKNIPKKEGGGWLNKYK